MQQLEIDFSADPTCVECGETLTENDTSPWSICSECCDYLDGLANLDFELNQRQNDTLDAQVDYQARVMRLPGTGSTYNQGRSNPGIHDEI